MTDLRRIAMKIKHLLVASAMLAGSSAEANVSVSGVETYQNSLGANMTTELPLMRATDAIGDRLDRHHLAAVDVEGSHFLQLMGKDLLFNLAGNPDHVAQTLNASTQASLFDTLVLSGEPTVSGKATMHMKMKFEIFQASEAQGVADPSYFPDYDFRMNGNDFATINTTNAVITGRKSTDYAFGVGNGGFSSSNIDGQNAYTNVTELLDFSLDLSFGSATPFSVQLTDMMTLDFTENERNFPWNGGNGHNLLLSFLNGISITDDTGKDLCGLTVSKLSGELWGKTAACSVDGGGGGGAGNVPEPASWTMLVGGFGLVGSVTRTARRRRAAAVG